MLGVIFLDLVPVPTVAEDLAGIGASIDVTLAMMSLLFMPFFYYKLKLSAKLCVLGLIISNIFVLRCYAPEVTGPVRSFSMNRYL